MSSQLRSLCLKAGCEAGAGSNTFCSELKPEPEPLEKFARSRSRNRNGKNYYISVNYYTYYTSTTQLCSSNSERSVRANYYLVSKLVWWSVVHGRLFTSIVSIISDVVMHLVRQLFCRKSPRHRKEARIRLRQFITEVNVVGGSSFLITFCARCVLYF